MRIRWPWKKQAASVVLPMTIERAEELEQQGQVPAVLSQLSTEQVGILVRHGLIPDNLEITERAAAERALIELERPATELPPPTQPTLVRSYDLATGEGITAEVVFDMSESQKLRVVRAKNLKNQQRKQRKPGRPNQARGGRR